MLRMSAWMDGWMDGQDTSAILTISVSRRTALGCCSCSYSYSYYDLLLHTDGISASAVLERRKPQGIHAWMGKKNGERAGDGMG